jgi:hypothetical protein
MRGSGAEAEVLPPMLQRGKRRLDPQAQEAGKENID